jgi:hypothetical protein
MGAGTTENGGGKGVPLRALRREIFRRGGTETERQKRLIEAEENRDNG